MQRLGLSAPDFTKALATLAIGYEKRIITRVLTRSGDLVSELSPRVLDGQVTVETSQIPSRALQMTLVDPTRSLGFEADGIGDMPLHQRRMIQVGYSWRVPELERWVNAWILTGPMKDLRRRGSEVEIAAYGKEALSMGTAWVPRTYRKGAKKTDVIRSLLASTGETRMAIPDLPAKMPNALHVRRLDKPFEHADKIAASMDLQLFYTGPGVATLRRRPKRAVITVDGGGPLAADGSLAMLTSEPEIVRPSDFHNIWEVLGRKPRGEKKRVSAIVSLPKAHPLSPHNPGMMRNGKPFYVGEQITNDHIRSKKEAQTKALRLRDDQARTTNEISCELMPLPVLDEADLVRVRTTQEIWIVRAKTFSIPVDTDEAQPFQLGSRRRTTRARKTVRIGKA